MAVNGRAGGAGVVLAVLVQVMQPTPLRTLLWQVVVPATVLQPAQAAGAERPSGRG